MAGRWGTNKPVALEQCSYMLVRSLALLDDGLASPLAASQLAFLRNSFQKLSKAQDHSTCPLKHLLSPVGVQTSFSAKIPQGPM